MLFTTLHRILHKQKWSYDGDTIMLYIDFSEVIYADFYAKILDWNFRLVDANSQILVVVFVSKLNLDLVFVSSTKTAEFSSSSSSLWRKLIYFRQRKFSFLSSSTKKKHCLLAQQYVASHLPFLTLQMTLPAKSQIPFRYMVWGWSQTGSKLVWTYLRPPSNLSATR